MATGCVGDETGERGDKQRDVGWGSSGKKNGHVRFPWCIWELSSNESLVRKLSLFSDKGSTSCGEDKASVRVSLLKQRHWRLA